MRSFTRGAVQLSLVPGLLALAGCATRQASYEVPAPFPLVVDSVRLTASPAVAPAMLATAPRDPREIVLADAEELIGTPYRYGGTTPERGFDCSGFVRWIYSRQGVALPRTARAMTKSGVRVPARRSVLLPGDLLFFAETGSRVSHVAVYAGDGRIVHASSGQGEVRYDDLDSARGAWFRRHIISARRVIPIE